MSFAIAPLIIGLVTSPTSRPKDSKLTDENREESAKLKALYEKAGHGMSQEKFGQTYGIGNQGAVWQCLNGRGMPISLKAAQGFAKGLNCKIEDFSPRLAAYAQTVADSLDDAPESAPAATEPRETSSNIQESVPISRRRKYPVISDVQAGEWTDIYDNFNPGDAEDWRECHKNLGPRGYVLRVTGDSMTAAAGAEYTFPAGYLLFVNPDLEPLPQKFVIARRESETAATFKRYVMLDGQPYLEALNPMWPNRYLKLLAGDVFCGVVVHAGKDLP